MKSKLKIVSPRLDNDGARCFLRTTGGQIRFMCLGLLSKHFDVPEGMEAYWLTATLEPHEEAHAFWVKRIVFRGGGGFEWWWNIRENGRYSYLLKACSQLLERRLAKLLGESKKIRLYVSVDFLE